MKLIKNEILYVDGPDYKKAKDVITTLDKLGWTFAVVRDLAQFRRYLSLLAKQAKRKYTTEKSYPDAIGHSQNFVTIYRIK